VCLANDAACIFSLDITEPGEPFESLAKRFPGKLEFQHCDVTSEESVAGALDAIVANKGRFDGMVANAGATKHQPALDFSLDQVKRLFELNVYGSWNCATAAARTFIKLGCKGSIVFTASMTSYRPNRVSLTRVG
jgi:NAD(P)-dependent dehydrogenase (short-subunit alcohol dehydrogenase family)